MIFGSEADFSLKHRASTIFKADAALVATVSVTATTGTTGEARLELKATLGEVADVGETEGCGEVIALDGDVRGFGEVGGETDI